MPRSKEVVEKVGTVGASLATIRVGWNQATPAGAGLLINVDEQTGANWKWVSERVE